MKRWKAGRLDCWKVVSLSILSTFPTVLPAQAGHDPGDSPYHDIRRGLVLRVVGGYFGGTRGLAHVGATQGPTLGLRLEYAASGALTFTSGLSYARTTAFYVTAYDSLPSLIGPNNSSILMLDLGVQISLTGGKTWHGVQPYVGATLGTAFGSQIAADTSGYDFGTKFTYAPEAGVRFYPSRRVSFELGGRMLAYRLSYPLTYRLHVLPIPIPLDEGTFHPWWSVGLGWTF